MEQISINHTKNWMWYLAILASIIAPLIVVNSMLSWYVTSCTLLGIIFIFSIKDIDFHFSSLVYKIFFLFFILLSGAIIVNEFPPTQPIPIVNFITGYNGVAEANIPPPSKSQTLLDNFQTTQRLWAPIINIGRPNNLIRNIIGTLSFMFCLIMVMSGYLYLDKF